MRADGSGVRRLTTTEDGISDSAPDWSPDCTRIVFASTRQTGTNLDLYVTDLRDGTVTRPTGDPVLDEVFPRWTAGGRQVVFTMFSDPVSGRLDDVWVVDGDGTDRRLLSRRPAADYLADPRPTSG